MDIVELLRVQEQKGVFDLPDDHKFVGWGEATDEIERLRGIINDDRLEGAADKIERLRKQVEFERASLQAAFRELRKQDGDIERLREQVEFERASLRSALEELKVSDKKIEWLQKEMQGQALREVSDGHC